MLCYKDAADRRFSQIFSLLPANFPQAGGFPPPAAARVRKSGGEIGPASPV